MIIYKCNGESFSGKKCSNEVKNDMPEWWLMICGKIKNGLHDAHYIEGNGTYHFCSRNCFENFFFKNKNATSATTGISDMNSNFDPNVKTEEAQEQAATESAAQDKAMEVQDSEEGTIEG